MRSVVRRLSSAPGFSATAVLTLAMGIGATVAMFAVVDGVLIKALPYPAPGRLIAIRHKAPGIAGVNDVMTSPTMFFTYGDDNHSFDALGLFTATAFTVTGAGDPQRVHGFGVTYGTLDALAVQPMLGRMFSKADDAPGRPETAILGYEYWQRSLGADGGVVGRGITLDGRPREIIGVMPRGFRILDDPADVLVPLRFDRSGATLGNFSYRAVARLKPGISLTQAAADIDRMIPIWLRSWPAGRGSTVQMFANGRFAASLQPLKDEVVGDVEATLWVILAVVGLVLLIACANVANLLLVRADRRQHEFAIRAALGAGWQQLAGDMMAEAALLAAAGGAIGAAFAGTGLKLLVASAPANMPRLDNVGLDARACGFAIAAASMSALLFGAVPVLKYASPRGVAAGMRGSGRTSTDSRPRRRARSTLVVVQCALALVLLVSAGLMIRTGLALRQIDPGFKSAEDVQTFRVSVPSAQVPDAERVLRMEQAIRDRLAAIPGVTAVSFTSGAPMDGNDSADSIFARDHEYASGTLPPIRTFRFIAPGLFDALGTRLIAGRDFTWNDVYGHRPVAIVSENLARELWRNPPDAVGNEITKNTAGIWREIVGVAADVRSRGVALPPPTTAYWPVLLEHFRGQEMRIERQVTFVIRTNRAGMQEFVDEARHAVLSVSGTIPIEQPRTLQALYDRSLARASFALWMLTIAAALALLLGIVGIYAAISYGVGQRIREIGVRLALGADRGSVRRMVVSEGVTLAAVGVLSGAAAAAVLTRAMSSLLFGVAAFDPGTYLAVSGLLLVAAALASYIPARRASLVDPAVSLRSD